MHLTQHRFFFFQKQKIDNDLHKTVSNDIDSKNLQLLFVIVSLLLLHLTYTILIHFLLYFYYLFETLIAMPKS